MFSEKRKGLYQTQIINSNNKIKTVWNIIKSVSGRQSEQKISKYENSLDSFNRFFLSTITNAKLHNTST